MKLEIPDKCFNDEELKNTPKRHERFLKEWLEGSNDFNFTTFDNCGVNNMIIVKDITFYSLCSHHLLPFFGSVEVGYIPNEKICGLSKIARVVDKISHKPQLQERMTEEIADFLFKNLNPKGVIVIVSGEHLCMSMRGIKKPGHKTITSSVRGCFNDLNVKEEFFQLINYKS